MSDSSCLDLSLAEQLVDLLRPAREPVNPRRKAVTTETCATRKPSLASPCSSVPSYLRSLIALFVDMQNSLVFAKINTPAVQTSRRLVGIRLIFLICSASSFLRLVFWHKPSLLATSRILLRCQSSSSLALYPITSPSSTEGEVDNWTHPGGLLMTMKSSLSQITLAFQSICSMLSVSRTYAFVNGNSLSSFNHVPSSASSTQNLSPYSCLSS
eukprot:748799-Hanusia_phi.AAC.2